MDVKSSSTKFHLRSPSSVPYCLTIFQFIPMADLIKGRYFITPQNIMEKKHDQTYIIRLQN